MLASIYVAGLWLLVIGVTGCATRGEYTADGQRQADQETADTHESQFQEVARQQAAEATASIRDRARVESQARQAAGILKGLLGLVSHTPNANQKVVSGLTLDVAQLSSGLDAIADSHNDKEFTAAVFEMCDKDSMQASTRVGPLLFGLGERIGSNPPANVPSDQVTTWAQYFEGLGETLIRIPRQCHHIQEAIAQFKAQAKAQDEPQRTKRHRDASMVMLCLAAGMLAPSPNRYPMGTGTRFGYAFERCQMDGEPFHEDQKDDTED
jgi:hypothetical protein